MTRNLPPLVALKTFEAAARLGSFRAAGEELSIHRTVVGRHVKNLEASLGVKLVEHSYLEMQLTVEGRHYLKRISPALNMIEDATESLRPGVNPDVRVWCGPGFNQLWLMPRLYFSRTPPPVNCVLLRATELPDFRRYEADVAIHFGRTYIPNSNSEELVSPRIMAVASPAFIAENPDIAEPADLLRAPLLHEQSTEWWVRWFQANGVPTDKRLDGERLGHSHVAIEAAAMGRGVALANEVMAKHEIDAGRIVEIVRGNSYFGSYYFYAAKDRWWESRIVRFRNWISSELISTIDRE